MTGWWRPRLALLVSEPCASLLEPASSLYVSMESRDSRAAMPVTPYSGVEAFAVTSWQDMRTPRSSFGSRMHSGPCGAHRL